MGVLHKTGVFLLVVCLCLTVSPARADLLAHYSFDGDTTSVTNNAPDYSLYFAGTLNGDAHIVYDAERDSDVLALDGIDSNADCDGVKIDETLMALELYWNNAATIAAWIWTEHPNYPHQGIFSQGPMANIYFGVRPPSEGGFLTNGGGAVVNSLDESELPGGTYLGMWTHVAVVMDDTMSYFYVNGLPFGEADRGVAIPTPQGIAVVGFEQGLDWRWTFDGFLDDVRIYNNALTAEEIAELAGLVTDPPPGDATRDGVVNKYDAQRLAANWLISGTEEDPLTWDQGDFNGDNVVDDLDASIMAANWLFGTEAVGVPEPSLIVLLAGGAFLLALARCRRPVR
ncbi:MAG: PEP-CTERM sorting domain-containing protein [Pirellulales bacterium]|nr:PEP-CTERM sorting domain-containing protein [Pirellulales bacterium]